MRIATLLAAVAIIVPVQVGAQECKDGTCKQIYHSWIVESDISSVVASTTSSTGGKLSYVCLRSSNSCGWDVFMPDADCTPKSKVVVTLAGDVEHMAEDAICHLVQTNQETLRSGRLLILSSDPKQYSSAIITQDVAISVQTANGGFAQHKFSRMGSALAMADVIQSFEHIKVLQPKQSSGQECRDGSCNQKRGEWLIETEPSGAHAVTSSKSGGMLSYMCLPHHPGCQWSIVMPEADCKPGSNVSVSIKGAGGVLLVSAFCKNIPERGLMPGAGRVLMLAGPISLITSAFSTQDTTASTRNTNGRVVQHQYPMHGASEAVQIADQWHIRLRNEAPAEQAKSQSRRFGSWVVTRQDAWIEAETHAETTGAVSYICPIGKTQCALGVHFPEADCQPKARVKVSLVGDRGSMSADATCLATSQTKGRFLMFGDPSGELLGTISGKYVTISTRNQNQAYVQHRFTTEGTAEAILFAATEQKKKTGKQP